MIANVDFLAGIAFDSGISVPDYNTDDDLFECDPKKFPHWTVYRNIQLGWPTSSPDSHFENARIIASISNEDIFTVTNGELIDLGVV